VRVRAPEAEVLRIAHPELRIWPAALLAQIDAALARPRRQAWGVATPRHLASSFLRCAVCGSSLVVSGTKSRNNLSYVCDKHRMHGRSACRGIGYRAEHAVDAALLRAVAPFIDGDVAQRALGLLKDRLEAQAKDHGRESARERVRRDLDAAHRKSRNLADAIARGGEMDALLVALREETGRIDGLRADLERVSHAAPVTFAKYFFVPAISCFARATSVSPVFMVFFLLSGPVLGDPQPLEDARTMRALRRSRRDVATRLVPVLSFLKNRHQGRVPG
jgi:Recombinase zinc beta ribbon domain